MRKEDTSIQPTALLPEEQHNHFTAARLTLWIQVPGTTAYRSLQEPTTDIFINISVPFSNIL